MKKHVKIDCLAESAKWCVEEGHVQIGKSSRRVQERLWDFIRQRDNKLLPHYTLKKNLCCYPRPTEIESSKAVICYQHKTIHLSDGYFGLLLPKLPSSDVSTNLNCDEVSTWLNWTSWYWQLPTLQFGVAKVYWVSLGIAANLYSIESNYAPHTDWLTDWLHLNAASNFLWQDLKTGFNTFKIQTSFLRCLQNTTSGSIYHKD